MEIKAIEKDMVVFINGSKYVFTKHQKNDTLEAVLYTKWEKENILDMYFLEKVANEVIRAYTARECMKGLNIDLFEVEKRFIKKNLPISYKYKTEDEKKVTIDRLRIVFIFHLKRYFPLINEKRALKYFHARYEFMDI